MHEIQRRLSWSCFSWGRPPRSSWLQHTFASACRVKARSTNVKWVICAPIANFPPLNNFTFPQSRIAAIMGTAPCHLEMITTSWLLMLTASRTHVLRIVEYADAFPPSMRFDLPQTRQITITSDSPLDATVIIFPCGKRLPLHFVTLELSQRLSFFSQICKIVKGTLPRFSATYATTTGTPIMVAIFRGSVPRDLHRHHHLYMQPHFRDTYATSRPFRFSDKSRKI